MIGVVKGGRKLMALFLFVVHDFNAFTIHQDINIEMLEI
jgi:hypothetical protein